MPGTKILQINLQQKMPKPFAGVITDTHMDEDSLDTVVDIFRQFVEFLKEQDLHLAFHLGDWFNNRSGQSLMCQLATKQILHYFADNSIKLVVIPGNHDKTDYGSLLSYLHTYNFIDYIHANWTGYHPVLLEEATVVHLREAPLLRLIFIPYFRERDVYPDQLLNVENQVLSGSQKNVLLTHIALDGARNNDGSIVRNGIGLEMLNSYDFIYSGHYHNRQPNYIGNPYQRDFGEHDNKGFCLLNDDGTIKYIKTKYKPYWKFEVLANDKDKLREILKEVDTSSVKVRIVFTGSADELESIDLPTLHKLGVQVKTKNTRELRLDFEDIDEADFKVFDRNDILKNYLEYTQKYKFDPKNRSQGFRILSNHL